MKRIALIVLALVAVLVAASTVSASTPPGRLAKASAASGQFAITSTNATVRRPSALYGRARGRIDSATFIVSCSRGFSITSNSLDRSRAGTWRLPMMRRPDSCDVVASAGGSGRIRIEIRYTR
jgi:hypothetical protein